MRGVQNSPKIEFHPYLRRSVLEDVCVHNNGILEVSTTRSTASSSNSSNNNTAIISMLLICLPTNRSLHPTKTFATKNCAPCAKEKIAILEQSRSNPQLLVDFNNEMCSACGHRPRFQRHANQTTSSTDESINDERASPTNAVTTDFDRCNVCLADV